MIYVDANVFLRHLVQPQTPQDVVNSARAKALFDEALHGRATLTSSDATIAEVVFILSHPKHYGYPRLQVAGAVADLLKVPGFRLHAKAVCFRALDLWATEPKLSFPDALGAAYSELEGHELATFDRALARVRGVPLHQWTT